MFEALEGLYRDHANLSRLLDLVERRLAAYGSGGPLDLEVLGSALDYLLHYPDLCHHPKEDLVYRRVRAIDPVAAAAVDYIVDEHKRLAELTRGFAAAVHNVAADAEMPRAWFENAGRELIGFNRHHMSKEERHLFPLALKALTARDWWEIDSAVLWPVDPLFSPKAEQQYQALHERIMQLGP